MKPSEQPPCEDEPTELRRALSLPLLCFYGLGTILGAGVYVLVGEVAAESRSLVPLAFLAAALIAGFTAFSYGELTSRIPRSAGEAAFVRAGLRHRALSALAGWGVVFTGIMSSATIAHGFYEYLLELAPAAAGIGRPGIVALVVVSLTLLAAWGVKQSVTAAAAVTVIEILGLLFVLVLAGRHLGDLPERWREFVPHSGLGDLTAILLGAHVAFFAFIGFEDIANMAEETRQARRTLPRAIIISLIVSSTLYFFVAIVAVLALPIGQLAGSDAPLARIVEARGAWAVRTISIISLVAVINGALIQVIMASRVLYGMARQGDAPAALGSIARGTRTPLIATTLVGLTILALALALRLEALARLTTTVTLIVFSLVNASLLRLKRAGSPPPPDGTFVVPRWVPACGLAASIGLLVLNAVLLAGRL